MAIINGTSGDDVLFTKKRGDILVSGDGDDTLVALHGFNILLGGDGDDRLTALSSFNILSGGSGNDVLRADRGWNLLLGGDGDDSLTSSSDHNILNGGEGDDTLAVLAGSGNILHGGDGDDLLSVRSDGNTLNGGDGDDLFNILGGSGNAVKGGAGRDTVSYEGTTQGVVVNLAAGMAAGIGTLSGIENVIGSDGDDVITGDDNDNVLEGGGGKDTIEGGAGNDIVDGGAGDDLIIGGEGAGDDTYVGGDGSDTVSYESTTQGVIANLATGMATGVEIGTDTLTGIENVIGGTGNDTLTGDANANILDGGAGNDTIKGGAGADSLVGGAGADTLLYDDSPTRVIVNMFNTSQIIIGPDTVNPNSVLDGFGTTDAISGFENVIGSAFNDYMQGASNVANRLEGGAGNDTLAGSGMTDSIAGAMDDTLLGGLGNDVLRQTRGNDSIDGGADFDRLEFLNNGIAYGGVFGVNVDLAAGTSDADAGGVDSVNGAGGDVATILGIEQVFGTAGNDILTGGSLARAGGGGFTEVFRGNAGDDTIDGRGTNTQLGSFDIDRVEYIDAPGPVWVNLATGMAFDGFGTIDTLLHVNHVMGSNFNDTLIGGNPEYDHTFERFEGRGGDDFMDGGSGIDEVSYQNASGPVTVNLGTGTGGGMTFDTFINMEGVRGSPFGDTLIGSDKPDVVEHFIGDGGNDTIDGGAGIDFASWQAVQLTAGGVNAFIENGAGTVFSPVGMDTLVNIEGLIGTNSNDMLSGGMGDQWFRGRGGSDLLSGGVGSDTADYSVDPGAVTVNLSTNSAIDGWGGIWAMQGTDTLSGIENVKGSQFNDSITGDINANLLDGGAGNDTIKGGAGADTLAGGLDTDTLVYDDSPTRVIVNMFMTSPITVGGITVDPGHAFDGFSPAIPFPATDTISGFETVIGSAFNDFIQGSTNVANLLVGGAGNDTLAGSGASDGINPPVPGAANDTLLGGTGDDVLRQSRGNDVIDGGVGFDRLEFINNGIAYGGAVGVNVNLATGDSYADPNNGDAVNDAEGDKATVSGIEFVVGTAGDDVFTGGDPLHAPGLAGSGQTEFFQPLGGDDTITGKAGRGWSTAVDYSSNNSLQSVTVVLGNSNNLGTASDGFGGTDTLIEVDFVRGGAGNDSLVGGSYNQGASGVFVEQFRGGAGNDTIDGGGSDTVIGAYGVVDRAEYSNSPFGVVVNTGVTPVFGTPNGTVNPGTARDGFDFLGGGTDTLIDINVLRGSNSIFGDLLVGGNPVFDNLERFEGLGGNDSLDGGSGNDEADYSSSPFGVVVNLGTSPISGNFYGAGVITVNGGAARDGFSSTGGGTDTLVSMEWARGGDFNDTLLGGANALERFTGGLGNDMIDGGSMTGVNYASFVLGTSGANASIANGVGTASNDGQGGTDTLANINGLWGSNFNDTLTGGLGDQWFIGSGGNDAIDGGENIDTVSYASDPNGAIVNLSGAPVVVGSETVAGGTARDGWGGIWSLQGTDTLSGIENVEGSNFNDSITGDANANRLEGRDGSDTIDGGAGNDTIVMLVTGGNVDAADGGTGNDTLALTGVVPNYTVFPNQNFVLVDLSFADQVLSIGGLYPVVDALVQQNFENLDASGLDGRITATGGDSVNTANIFIGANGNDAIRGGGGNDTIRGGAGDDFIDGGAGGGDRIDFSDATGGINFTLNQGTNPGDPLNGLWSSGALAGIGTDSYKNIEGVFGSNFADTLTGSSGNDVIRGNGGDDSINGSGGNDTIRGGDGNDTIDGGDGGDLISFGDATGGINFTLNQGTNGGGFWSSGALPGIGTDSYRNIEGVAGTNFNDTLTGSGSDDTLRGSAGDDTIDGGAGADLLDLSDGTAGIIFTLVNDVIDTTVNLSSIGLSSATGDTYRNMEGVIGTNFSDTLIGSANDDVLTGGGGTDIMTGNAGIDSFDFNATFESSTNLALSDVVIDFVHGIDKIDLSTIDANTGVGGNQAFLFGGNNASTVANSVTWFETGGGNTVLQIDVNGNTAADMQIVLSGTSLGLTDSDFIL